MGRHGNGGNSLPTAPNQCRNLTLKKSPAVILSAMGYHVIIHERRGYLNEFKKQFWLIRLTWTLCCDVPAQLAIIRKTHNDR
jgi:hypothetical protein